jgi:transposase
MENNGKIRRVHPAAFKAKVALEAIKEQKTIAELASTYGVHSTQINKWKQQALAGLTELFSDKKNRQKQDTGQLIQMLYQQIGKQKVEIDWLKKKIGLIEYEFKVTG